MKNIDKALTKKDGTQNYAISAAEKKAIDDIYRAYDSAKGMASPALKGVTMSSALREAMKKAYNQVRVNGRLEKFRDKILIGADLCPCCGIGDADELDHHLPKDDYELLAIYSHNLVPYCHKCNNKKRSLDGSDPNKRFINAYYDDVPDATQFLFANVRMHGKGLNVKLEVRHVTGLTPQMVNQMNFQMRRVNLNKRLKKAVNIHLSSMANNLEDNYLSGGKAAVQVNLRSTGKSLQKRFGMNHWRSVVLFALADHDAFCNGGFYEPLGLDRPGRIVRSPSTP